VAGNREAADGPLTFPIVAELSCKCGEPVKVPIQIPGGVIATFRKIRDFPN
jgi:hypothetical protein